MSRIRYRKCIQCDKPGTADEPISSRGLCLMCGLRNWEESQAQISAQSGPVYNKYMRKAALGYLRYLERLGMGEPPEGNNEGTVTNT